MGKTVSREWVKTAAIIFLSVLLFLTFFSNTIMNHTLPEVSSAAVTDGPITAKVRGSGTVEAISQTEVKASATRYVGTVNVKEGQEVEVGDVLFTMGAAESEEVEAAQDKLDSLYWERRRASASYPINSNSALYRELQRTDKELAAAELAYEAAWSQVYNPDGTEKQGPSKQELDEAYQNMLDAEYAYDAAISVADSRRADAKALFLKALDEYSDLPLEEQTPENYAIIVQNYEDNYTALMLEQSDETETRKAYDEAKKEYNNKVNEQIPGLKQSLAAAERNLDNATDAYYAAYDQYMTSLATNGQASANVSINIGEIDEKIGKAEKKVAELEGTENNEIAATVAGVVTSVGVSPGARVEKDMVMCIIEVPDRGYSCSFSVTNDQAKRLKVGDTAEVSNYYWGSSILATLTSIKVDTKDPQTKKVLTFDLDGDVNAGTLLTISVGSKSSNYDVIVPNSAVRTDSNGKFVLMLDAKNSPLGNRYFAKRVDVEVLAEDDINSAISGNISNGDFVITTTSSPIKSGDQVRMSDNG